MRPWCYRWCYHEPFCQRADLPCPLVTPLTADDIALLDFEDQWWRYPGAKEEATRYYQRLVAIIEHPDAVRLRPLIVRRLQRLRVRRALRAFEGTASRPAR